MKTRDEDAMANAWRNRSCLWRESPWPSGPPMEMKVAPALVGQTATSAPDRQVRLFDATSNRAVLTLGGTCDQWFARKNRSSEQFWPGLAVPLARLFHDHRSEAR